MATTATTASPFFEPHRLAGLERMRFSPRRRMEGSHAGRHSARRLGGAGEFVDYREYAPGDDLRRLDWRVLARTGRSYLKLFQDETDLPCTLVLDTSGSMLQGGESAIQTSGSKLAWSQYFATALSHLMLLGHDAVGLALAGAELSEFRKPSSAVAQRALLHDSLARIEAQGESHLAEALDGLILQLRQRGVVLIISDFLVDSLDRLVQSLRKYRACGWELICLHVVHPEEERLPEGTSFRFVGWEDASEVRCQVAEVRAAYERRFARHLAATRQALVGLGCDYYLARTDTDYLHWVRSFLMVRTG